jgi:hypothetical protein
MIQPTIAEAPGSVTPVQTQNTPIILFHQKLVNAGISSHPHLMKDEDGAVHFDPSRVQYYANNPRKTFRRIPQLADSMLGAGKQVTPGVVILLHGDKEFDAVLVDGERRIRACRHIRGNIDKNWHFRAFINSSIKDERSHFVESFTANFGKEDHDCIEIAHGIRRLQGMGFTLGEIGKMAGGKSAGWASQYLNLLKLHPTVQQMLVPGENDEADADRTLSYALAQRLSSLPHAQQLEGAKVIAANGMRQSKARRYIMQLGRKAGKVAFTGRKRSEGMSSLLNLLESTLDTIGIYKDMTPEELDLMFRAASYPEKRLLLKRLGGLAEDIVLLSKVTQAQLKD